MIIMKARAKKTWPCVHTGPLVEFLLGIYPEGIPLADLSSKLGVSVSVISNSFRVDNMHLSRAEAIAKVYGYDLRLIYRYRGQYPSDSVYTPSRNVGTIYGIEEYCQRLKRTYHFIATNAGFNGRALASAINKGDIMLDRLNRISTCLGLSIDWVFIKKDDVQ